MKVLVATKKTQGQRKNDFSWAMEGELLTFTMVCDGEEVDGPCGCLRSMAGLDSRRSTTTMEVVERPITKAGFTKAVASSLVAAGWYKSQEAAKQPAADDAKKLAAIAKGFPVGTVLEKRGPSFQVRKVT